MNPDRALVDSVLARQPGAFEQLMRQYQGLCWHIVYRMVRHSDDARDLCQETFLRVYQNLGQYRYESPLKYWIGRVDYSIALRHLERQRLPTGEQVDGVDPMVLAENEADSFDFAAACEDADSAHHLRAAIDALAPVQRTVLTLHYLEDLPIPEIAQITGLPAGTIKSHLFRSRLRLREMLESS